ncbi:MAG: bacterial transcriptional activator domain-containing protein [Accumulibacter sp.]|uniref:AfsR/SARP family transcriptional regulator n=1 Tax=Accumulibacter sp. TaxID=2053492 RepID=UPI002FC3DA70
MARVVAALWGEEEAPSGPPNGRSKNGGAEASRGAFDITLARLQQRLRQSDALQVDDGYLTLNPHRCWVDLWQLQRRLNETRATLAGNAEETVTRLAAHSRALLAFAPWDFLPAEGAPWARSARQTLRAQVIDVLADLASALGDLGQGAQFCALCRAALAVDAGREPLYRVWMCGLYEQGEHAEALRVYRRCREALAREFQTVPSPPTEALRKTIEEASPPPAPGS